MMQYITRESTQKDTHVHLLASTQTNVKKQNNKTTKQQNNKTTRDCTTTLYDRRCFKAPVVKKFIKNLLLEIQLSIFLFLHSYDATLVTKKVPAGAHFFQN